MNSSIDAQNAVLNSISWKLSDLEKIPKNGLKVMSTFSCGGGSTMGYKLAGCNVIAANDIDPEMAWHYKKNLNPKHYFLCPIKDLLKADLPSELYNLDILDGSPPCSTFSMAGKREKNWGKNKKFREGQAKQKLSDLFFDFIDVAEKLKPKVIIAENVKGLILGNAKGYTKMIMHRFRDIGYRPQLFLVNAVNCGVPQKRERVFFCCLRSDINKPLLELKLNSKVLTVEQACSDIQDLTDDEIRHNSMEKKALSLYNFVKKGSNFQDACKLKYKKNNYFGHIRINEKLPSPTVLTKQKALCHWDNKRALTFREFKRLGAFPDDYQAKSENIGKYMVGMSVPPKMTARIALKVIEQWLSTSMLP